jgi:hypothetical protein
MTDAPAKITAWVNKDGTPQFSGDKLFPQGVEEEYTRTALCARVVKALLELTICVEDGCYCSEMRLAAAVDEANSALKSVGETK